MDKEDTMKEEKVKFSQAADKGFSNATSYDIHRPTYPPSAVSSLLTHLNLASSTSLSSDPSEKIKILELGAGTGKFTEALAAREEGYEIVAVEPQKEMRGVLEGKGLKGVRVIEGVGESLGGLGDSWADGVVVAQAFHWFANDESLREIHRVLKPGGSLGLIWNIEDYNSPLSWPTKTPWDERLKNLTWSLPQDDTPRFRALTWLEIFNSPSSASGPLSNPVQTLKATFSSSEEPVDVKKPLFSLPIGEEKQEWSVRLGKEALWERYCTLSQMALLGGREREEARRVFDEAVEMSGGSGDGEVEVEVHGVTVLYWMSRV